MRISNDTSCTILILISRGSLTILSELINRVMTKRTILFTYILLFLVTVKCSHAACEFTWPQGHQKIPCGHQPEVNGCGAQGTIDFNPLFPAFTEICNEHDRCYGKCRASRAYCDEKFSREMHKYCDSWRKNSVDFFHNCKGIASLYTAGVTALGCSFYLAAQKQACSCVHSRSV